MNRFGQVLVLAALACAFAHGQQPETVMATLRPKAGNEAAMAAVIEKHWSTARRLNLIEPAPYLTFRLSDAGKAYFVHIFTWRSAQIPDNAPAEIRAIWAEMNALAEVREGRPALDIVEVYPVAVTP